MKGRIDQHWSGLFEELTITHTEEDETVLTGSVAAQEALYGLPAKLRDLGLALMVVNSEAEEPRS